MITLETLTEVEQNRTATIELPKSVQPGPHRMVLLIEEQLCSGTARPKAAGPLRLRKLQLHGWPGDATFRREDIYGDAGR
ncbi:MAG: hypothetical protein HYY24_15015 [Verrucomicrobia bacterium]|nr:hypothetical protein [Verrucomicrobiota bacterium]